MNSDGSFTGTADTFSAGTYTVGINVNDGNMGVADTVLVIIVNRLPSFSDAVTNISQMINEGQGLTALEAADPDRDTLTYGVISGVLPDGITLNSNGSFSGTTSSSPAGLYTIVIGVSDSKGGTDQTELVITVTRPSGGDDDDDDEDDSSDSNNNSGNNTSNGTSNNNGLPVIQPSNPRNTPDAVFNDSQPVGINKPVQQIQQELQQAGVRDVNPTDWFAGSVTVLIQSDLLRPDTDGNFHPEANVPLEEGISVFAKVLGIAAKDDTPFQAVAKMQEAGLLGNNIGMGQGLSRLEFARVLGRALGLETSPIMSRDQYPFADFDSVTPEERGFIKMMYVLGIVKGYMNDGIRTFSPNEILTRAQLAIMVDRILGAQQ